MSSLIAPGFALETVRKQKNGCSCGKERIPSSDVLQNLVGQITRRACTHSGADIKFQQHPVIYDNTKGFIIYYTRSNLFYTVGKSCNRYKPLQVLTVNT
jgi:hypothetical protein